MAKADATALAPLGLNTGTILVRPINLFPNGQAQFFLPSTADRRYAIQATTNYVHWVNLLTNVPTGNFLDSVDEDAPTHTVAVQSRALRRPRPFAAARGRILPDQIRASIRQAPRGAIQGPGRIK